MLEHGGKLREAAAQYGIALERWLDLSTGINPHGWPVPIVPAVLWQRLPESEDGLENAAAAYYGTPELLPVAGSQAAIQALPLLRSIGRVGVLHPTYAEHAHAWRQAGHQVELLQVDQIAMALDWLDVLVLVNPNNPDGVLFPAEMLLDWRQRLAMRNGWLVVDEAFADVAPKESVLQPTALPGLIVLRSLGKFFGLAGARIGFVMAEATLRGALRERLGPWSVSAPSRWTAMQALSDRVWQEQARDGVLRAGQRLAELLDRQGLTVAGGAALFQWAPTPHAGFWQDALARRGILVRRFTQPSGLRFGLPGLAADWRRLERALVGIRAERLYGV